MSIPGGFEIFLISGLFLLALMGLGAKFVSIWLQEGYVEGMDEELPTG